MIRKNRTPFTTTQKTVVSILVYSSVMPSPVVAQNTPAPQVWPSPPITDKTLYYKTAQGMKPVVKIEAASAISSPYDPLQEIATKSSLRGTIIYTPLLNNPNLAEAQKSFVFHGVNLSGKVDGKVS